MQLKPVELNASEPMMKPRKGMTERKSGAGTFAFETKYSDYQIIGCAAPGVKLAGMLVRRYIGTSEVIVVL